MYLSKCATIATSIQIEANIDIYRFCDDEICAEKETNKQTIHIQTYIHKHTHHTHLKRKKIKQIKLNELPLILGENE